MGTHQKHLAHPPVRGERLRYRCDLLILQRIPRALPPRMKHLSVHLQIVPVLNLSRGHVLIPDQGMHRRRRDRLGCTVLWNGTSVDQGWLVEGGLHGTYEYIAWSICGTSC